MFLSIQEENTSCHSKLQSPTSHHRLLLEVNDRTMSPTQNYLTETFLL